MCVLFCFIGLFYPLREVVNLRHCGDVLHCLNCGSNVGRLHGDRDSSEAAVDLIHIKIYFFGHVYSVRRSICGRTSCLNDACDSAILRRGVDSYNRNTSVIPNSIFPHPPVAVSMRNCVLRSPSLALSGRGVLAEQCCIPLRFRTYEEIRLIWCKAGISSAVSNASYAYQQLPLARSGNDFYYSLFFCLLFLSPCYNFYVFCSVSSY